MGELVLFDRLETVSDLPAVGPQAEDIGLSTPIACKFEDGQNVESNYAKQWRDLSLGRQFVIDSFFRYDGNKLITISQSEGVSGPDVDGLAIFLSGAPYSDQLSVEIYNGTDYVVWIFPTSIIGTLSVGDIIHIALVFDTSPTIGETVLRVYINNVELSGSAAVDTGVANTRYSYSIGHPTSSLNSHGAFDNLKIQKGLITDFKGRMNNERDGLVDTGRMP